MSAQMMFAPKAVRNDKREIVACHETGRCCGGARGTCRNLAHCELLEARCRKVAGCRMECDTCDAAVGG